MRKIKKYILITITLLTTILLVSCAKNYNFTKNSENIFHNRAEFEYVLNKEISNFNPDSILATLKIGDEKVDNVSFNSKNTKKDNSLVFNFEFLKLKTQTKYNATIYATINLEMKKLFNFSFTTTKTSMGLTKDKPFKISSLDDYKKVTQLVNSSFEEYSKYHFTLENDIDLENSNIEPLFLPKNNKNALFTGSFDGKNHTIKNANVIYSPNEDKEFKQTALLGNLGSGSVVENINFENIKVSSTDEVNEKDLNFGLLFGIVDENAKVNNIKLNNVSIDLKSEAKGSKKINLGLISYINKGDITNVNILKSNILYGFKDYKTLNYYDTLRVNIGLLTAESTITSTVSNIVIDKLSNIDYKKPIFAEAPTTYANKFIISNVASVIGLSLSNKVENIVSYANINISAYGSVKEDEAYFRVEGPGSKITLYEENNSKFTKLSEFTGSTIVKKGKTVYVEIPQMAEKNQLSSILLNYNTPIDKNNVLSANIDNKDVHILPLDINKSTVLQLFYKDSKKTDLVVNDLVGSPTASSKLSYDNKLLEYKILNPKPNNTYKYNDIIQVKIEKSILFGYGSLNIDHKYPYKVVISPNQYYSTVAANIYTVNPDNIVDDIISLPVLFDKQVMHIYYMASSDTNVSGIAASVNNISNSLFGGKISFDAKSTNKEFNRVLVGGIYAKKDNSQNMSTNLYLQDVEFNITKINDTFDNQNSKFDLFVNYSGSNLENIDIFNSLKYKVDNKDVDTSNITFKKISDVNLPKFINDNIVK